MSAGDCDGDDQRHVTGSFLLSSPEYVIVATPLALLSAKEARFRAELIRRKEHFKLGGTGKKESLNLEGSDKHIPKGSEQLNTMVPLAQEDWKTWSLRPEERETLTTIPPCALRGKPNHSSDHVGVIRSPLMASTRPAGAQSLAQPRQALDEGSDSLEPRTGLTRPNLPNGVDERARRKYTASRVPVVILPRPGRAKANSSFRSLDHRRIDRYRPA